MAWVCFPTAVLVGWVSKVCVELWRGLNFGHLGVGISYLRRRLSKDKLHGI